ncbi:MAG: hypothetical protein ACOC31_02095 [Bacteroidota bacterium]
MKNYEFIRSIPAWDVLKEMERVVRENAAKMSYNNEVTKFIINTEQVSRERSAKLDSYNAQNNKISKKNIRFIEMHKDLLDFLNQLANELVEQENTTEAKEVVQNKMEGSEGIRQEEPALASEKPGNKPQQTMSFDEAFAGVIEQRISFNENNPFYNNEGFRKKLLDYYTDKEEYEKCAWIVSL